MLVACMQAHNLARGRQAEVPHRLPSGKLDHDHKESASLCRVRLGARIEDIVGRTQFVVFVAPTTIAMPSVNTSPAKL